MSTNPSISNSEIKIIINLLDLRVLTHTPKGAECVKFSNAEPGSVWDEIFKNHMNIDESCIGAEKALKQMEESEELYTTFYQSRGKYPCSRVFFFKICLISKATSKL